MNLSPIFENIPGELKHFPQWVNWKSVPRKEGGKPTKPPFQPNGKLAKTDDPATWSPFSVVKDTAPRFDGVGFVLTNGDPYVALDFDHCRCPAFDGLTPWANTLDMVVPEIADYVRKLNSYAEVSPSGTGIRMFVEANLPVDGKRKGPIEVYQNGRYVTLTGRTIDGCSRTINHRQAEVDAFYRAVLEATEGGPEQPKEPRTDKTPGDWRNLLDVAFQSQNGPEIKSLWEGNMSSYPSQSEADLALCSHLAFWLGGDSAAMDAAFRASGLYREKWDVKHHGDGSTYGEATIKKALAGCSSFYGDAPQSQGGEAPPEAWPEPIPFNDYSLLPEFPVEVIPGVCGRMVKELSTSCQVDAGLPGSQMLAVLSAAIGARLRIDLDSHTEQGNLYFLSIIGSGNRKTETNSQLTSPIHAYQKARRDAMSPLIREAENKMRILGKRLEKLEKEAANKNDPDERDILMRDCREILREIGQNPVPPMPTYLVDDITPERLGSLMADNDERAAILSAEGGFFKIIAGLYSKGHAANIDLILKAHAGDAWSSDRVGREGKAMEHPALTLGLMVQPDVLEEIGRNSEFRGRGLSARFLYTWCQSKAGYRTRQTSPVSPSVKEAYHRWMESLLELEGKYDLRLSPDAQTVWNEFSDDVEKLLRPGANLEHLVDWGSKLAGAVARISGLLHFAEHGPAGIGKPVSADSMTNACYLGAYYIKHAKASFGIMREDARLAVARKILDYIKRHRPERFKGRDLFNHTNCASMDEINPGLTILIERGFVREAGRIEHRGRVGRPESTTFEVNPRSF